MSDKIELSGLFQYGQAQMGAIGERIKQLKDAIRTLEALRDAGETVEPLLGNARALLSTNEILMNRFGSPKKEGT